MQAAAGKFEGGEDLPDLSKPDSGNGKQMAKRDPRFTQRSRGHLYFASWIARAKHAANKSTLELNSRNGLLPASFSTMIPSLYCKLSIF